MPLHHHLSSLISMHSFHNQIRHLIKMHNTMISSSSSSRIFDTPYEEYLKIISWNVNRCDAEYSPKIKAIDEFLEQYDHQLIILQEYKTHIPWRASTQYENLLLQDGERVKIIELGRILLKKIIARLSGQDRNQTRPSGPNDSLVSSHVSYTLKHVLSFSPGPGRTVRPTGYPYLIYTQLKKKKISPCLCFCYATHEAKNFLQEFMQFPCVIFPTCFLIFYNLFLISFNSYLPRVVQLFKLIPSWGYFIFCTSFAIVY